jgi:hypothetical protein
MALSRFGRVIVNFISHNLQAQWAAPVDKAARFTLHPHPIALAPADTTALVAEWAQHLQPAERHKNPHECTDKTEGN